MLLMFPFGLLAVAVILDVFRALGAPHLVGTLAYCTIAAGLVGGAMTAGALWIDALATRDRTAGPQRFLLDLAVLVVFAVVLLLRMRTPDRTAPTGVLVVELLGLTIAAAGAWYGAGAVRPRAERGMSR
ncbi:hypothetical protein BG844_00210 [Couchioplanes caeruleus subsp. caeruleus]|uniref:DUF2231 domain-containing protein n=1 Tax=Couchioplanes caeruleus subsp. caeruleus TaxID=56427 RepID=A0A1K0FTY7_9ACTN|nr:hypothetical protein BG844_00210 [Couchioplanes caeruleus subsp. caeruleus]